MKKTAFLQILFCFFLLTGLALFLTPAYGEEPENNTDPEEDKIYEPLFGEKQTSYTIWEDAVDASGTSCLAYIKDTLIDAQTYKIFDIDRIGGWVESPCYLRVNEENSKVYCRNWKYEKELLVFDLTLNIGDTFLTYKEDEYTVDSIYTDAKGRKNIRLVNDDFFSNRGKIYILFIEGAGSSYGFFPTEVADNTFQLCGEKDGVKSYYYYEDYYDIFIKCSTDQHCPFLNDLFFKIPQCFFPGTSAINHTEKKETFLLYPNLCREYVTIDKSEEITMGTYRICLSDYLGRTYLQQETEDFPVRLQTGNLLPGNYLIRIFSDEKEIASNLLIVKE